MAGKKKSSGVVGESLPVAGLSTVLSSVGGDALLKCVIQPRASRRTIVGIHGNELKIALTAPPVDGQANKLLCEFIADSFRLPKSRVLIKSGLTSRHKAVELSGLASAEAENILKEYLGK